MQGNELADKAARDASTKERTVRPISYNGYAAAAEASRKRKCNEKWGRTRCKMRELNETFVAWEKVSL